jgi:UDPglucose--hexose-1-phosphate uridylyltransferase
MPELRKDPIIGRWVIIATERAKRPQDFAAIHNANNEPSCPFCDGNEKQTPPEILAIREPHAAQPNSPGWQVRVVPSISPVLHVEGNLDRRGKGMYDMMNGIGAHEIIIETPKHESSIADLKDQQIEKILNVYINRMVDLQRDKRFKYTLLFKNYRFISGASIIRHCRSQLIAMPVNPKRVKEELVGAKRYYDYKERCIFCDIIKQEIDTKQRVILDSDGFIAITPFASRFPFEIWIMPKDHSADFINIDRGKLLNLATTLRTVLKKLSIALNDPPYNYILHTAPCRVPIAGYWKTIDSDYHWHIEIMPRLTRMAGFEWGSGFYINPTPPEEAAAFLREVKI